MNKFGVYKIECNEKLYIGSTMVGFSVRWNAHLNKLRAGTHANCYLQRAFNKYGESALRFSIIEIVETAEGVLPIEQHYIDTLIPEYNICPIAGSPMAGRKMSKEQKQKLSEAHKGRVFSEETRCKIGMASAGRVRSEETRRKIGMARLGIRNCLGIKRSEETRRKMSVAHIGNTNSLGHSHSEETRRKISESLKLHYAGHTNEEVPK